MSSSSNDNAARYSGASMHAAWNFSPAAGRYRLPVARALLFFPTRNDRTRRCMKSANPKLKYPKPGKNEEPQEFPGSEESMHEKPDYGRDTYKGSGKLN